MRQTVFSYLRWINPKPTANSEEQMFFDSHASLFTAKTAVYNDPGSLFGLIRADIVLHGESNRQAIHKFVSMMPGDVLALDCVSKACKDKLPYMDYHGHQIFIPQYPIGLNAIYADHPEELLKDPYKVCLRDANRFVINPFETYGNHLYSSSFTRLARLDVTDGDSDAFYHIGFQTLFIIDKKGSLIEEIPLFDEKDHYPYQDGLFEKLHLLLNDYYGNDRDGFLDHLLTLGFVSKPLHERLVHIAKSNDDLRKKRLSK